MNAQEARNLTAVPEDNTAVSDDLLEHIFSCIRWAAQRGEFFEEFNIKSPSTYYALVNLLKAQGYTILPRPRSEGEVFSFTVSWNPVWEEQRNLDKFRGYTSATARVEGINFSEGPDFIELEGRSLLLSWPNGVQLRVPEYGNMEISANHPVDITWFRDLINAVYFPGY